MPSTVAQMSKRELAQVISNIVEQKLIELFGDPDEDLSMKDTLRKRLVRQKKMVAKGERGTNLATVRRQLGI